MKKILFLIFASLLVLGACGQNGDNSNKNDNKKSESKSDKKSNGPKKSDSKDKSNKNTNDDKQQASSDDINDGTTSNKSESTSKNDNGRTQSNINNNEQPQNKQTQGMEQNRQQQVNNNQQQNNNNGYMTQDEINDWNKNKPTTHDESQMGYGRGDYEQALKESQKVWNDPNAHVGGPRWVGKNEGYESWAKRQQEVQNSVAE